VPPSIRPGGQNPRRRGARGARRNVKRAKYMYLDHGYYLVSARLARQIAGGTLPRPGREKLAPAPPDFHASANGFVWVAQTVHNRRRVWAIRDSQGWVLDASGQAVLGGRSNPRRRGGRGRFAHRRVRSPGRFVASSLRTVRAGKARVVVGHLKGERRRTKAGRTKQTVQAILTPKRRRRKVGARSLRVGARRPSTARRVSRSRTGHTQNPTLAVLGANPPRSQTLGTATRIEYTHAQDGRRYFHDFRPGARVSLKSDGSVTLRHARHRLWQLFPK